LSCKVVRQLQHHPELVVVLAGVSAALHVAKMSPAIPVPRYVLAFADVGRGPSLGGAAVLRHLGVLLFSMVGGLIPGTLFSLAVRLTPDESSISTTVGWVQQLSAPGQFLGPPLVAWIAAGARGWQRTWVATGGCCVLGLIVAREIHRLNHAGH
jgi:hypothetical protein